MARGRAAHMQPSNASFQRWMAALKAPSNPLPPLRLQYQHAASLLMSGHKQAKSSTKRLPTNPNQAPPPAAHSSSARAPGCSGAPRGGCGPPRSQSWPPQTRPAGPPRPAGREGGGGGGGQGGCSMLSQLRAWHGRRAAGLKAKHVGSPGLHGSAARNARGPRCSLQPEAPVLQPSPHLQSGVVHGSALAAAGSARLAAQQLVKLACRESDGVVGEGGLACQPASQPASQLAYMPAANMASC